MFNETIQCGDQFSTGSRFGHEGIAQGVHCTYKFGGLVNCEEDNLRGRGDLAYLVRCLDGYPLSPPRLNHSEESTKLSRAYSGLLRAPGSCADHSHRCRSIEPVPATK